MTHAPPILAAGWALSPQWAFNRWLVVLVVVLSCALVIHLYRTQQRIASRGVVLVLTGLRILLVLLAFVLLAGLAVRWKHQGSSGGTLWVVIDQSGSMSRADSQATPAEKLRWADALGYLPAGVRQSRPDRAAARLAAFRADLGHLRTVGEIPQNGGDYRAALQAWADGLAALADDVQKDSHASRAVADAIRAAAQRMRSSIDKASAKRTPAEVAAAVPWDEMRKALDWPLAALHGLADAADEKFLAEHAADAGIAEALAKVSGLTRAELARLALTAKLADVIPRQRTRVVAFADTPQNITLKNTSDFTGALKAVAKDPAGQSTNMAAPLQFVGQNTAQDEPAAIVFIGDGRHNTGGDLVEPARQLAARGVRVFTAAVGSAQVVPDAAVEQVDAPDWVYQDDTVRASALLRLDALASKPVTVEFYRGDKKVDTKTVTPQQDRATQVVSFSDRPPEPGVFEYDVRVADAPGEAVKENNRLGSRVAVKKDKLAVLVVEDQPRWEYRHLVNYLSRDRRVKLQTVLLQPAQVENVERPQPVAASPSNERVEAQLLPARREDWAAFDLVVLGDVPKEALGEQAQRDLAWAVRERGATLLLIAGPFNMPQRFGGTPLADLSPVDLSTSDWGASALPNHLRSGFRPAVAPEGHASVLAQFTIDEPASAALWSALPPWYWHSEYTQAKRTASVVWAIGDPPAQVATSRPADNPGTLDEIRRRTLLATSSVGMGRVMYLASDSTWRMRQVNGQNPHERFWGQVIRWVVGNELPAGGKLVRFGTDKPRYVAGQPVIVTARLLGQDYSPQKGQQIKAVARAADKTVAEADLVELPDAPGYYRATLGAVPAGRIDVSLSGEAVARLFDAEQVAAAQRTLAVDVQSQLGVEQRNVNVDRAAMARLAEAGDGIALDGSYVDVLAAHLPKLNYDTETVEQYGLFADPKDPRTRTTHWVFLSLFAAVATAEWVIRKAAGLV